MISSLVTNNWITITFIFMIGLLVIANYFFERRFLKFRKLFYSKQYFVEYISITTVFHPFNILFLFFQVSFYALLALKIVEYFNPLMVKNQLFLFLKLVFGILTFYIFRYFIGKVIALFFKLKKDYEVLSFMKFSYLSKIALILFPILILLHYFDFKNGILFLVLATCTIFLLLLKYLDLLRKNQKLIFSKLFYFILYICALEILPIVVVYKTLIVRD
ncbi:MAG: DUF4271 domain-containing protein [Flavobacteriaceae bacterium]|nr:DUF4271 domain-containing protein [Flavobacteriaceae bacterium]